MDKFLKLLRKSFGILINYNIEYSIQNLPLSFTRLLRKKTFLL